MNNVISSTLDKEWERLLVAAREIGLTPTDVRKFLKREAVNKKFDVEETSENVS